MRERVKITDYLFFQEGPGVRNTQYTTSGVKLLNVSNLVDGEIDLTNSDRYISNEEAYGKYKHFLVDEGDLIIASSGIKVDYLDKKVGFIKKEHLPLCMNTSTIRFKTLDDKVLSIKYFKYYLQSNDFKYQVSKSITGSAQLNYGPSHLKQMTFILYGLNEQNEIVERLDSIDNLIQKHKEVIYNLDTLIKARFVEMFGDPLSNKKRWEKKKLGEKCEIITGNTPSRNNQQYYGDYIEWIKSDNINTPSIFLTKAHEYLSEVGAKVGRIVEKGAVLMTCIAGSLSCIGNVGIADRKVAFNQQINAIIPSNDNPYYLYVLFLFTKKELQSSVDMMLKGIVSKRKLESQEYIFPPIELQNQFAIFVNHVDKLKFDVQKSLEKTQMLFDSLMQEYFG